VPWRPKLGKLQRSPGLWILGKETKRGDKGKGEMGEKEREKKEKEIKKEKEKSMIDLTHFDFRTLAAMSLLSILL